MIISILNIFTGFHIIKRILSTWLLNGCMYLLNRERFDIGALRPVRVPPNARPRLPTDRRRAITNGTWHYLQSYRFRHTHVSKHNVISVRDVKFLEALREHDIEVHPTSFTLTNGVELWGSK
jgi:hypothetical protein